MRYQEYFFVLNLDYIPPELWSIIVSYLQLIDILNLPFCSKYFYQICSKNKRFSDAKNISQKLLSNNKEFYLFMAEILIDYSNTLLQEFGLEIRPFVFPKFRCWIIDSQLEMTTVKIYCHLFHCDRLHNSCQYCTLVSIDSMTLSYYIYRKLNFEKESFHPIIAKKFMSGNISLNVQGLTFQSKKFIVSIFDVIYCPSTLNIV